MLAAAVFLFHFHFLSYITFLLPPDLFPQLLFFFLIIDISTSTHTKTKFHQL